MGVDTTCRLTLLTLRHTKTKQGWRSLFACSCGNTKLLRSCEVKSGKIRSCGCLKKEMVAAKNYIHGEAARGAASCEYMIWASMVERCYSATNKDFGRYGGRGITVCQAWRDSCLVFIEDMGRKPDKNSTLDRVDNDLGYNPSNCKWSTRKEQANNTSRTVFITANGETKPLTEWARLLGLKDATLYSRVTTYGWSDQEAVNGCRSDVK